MDDVTDKKAIHAAKQSELGGSVDILLRKYQQIDRAGLLRAPGRRDATPRRQQKADTDLWEKTHPEINPAAVLRRPVGRRLRSTMRLASQSCRSGVLKPREMEDARISSLVRATWRPFGGIGLGSLEGCVAGFAGGSAATFARSMPLPNNRCSLATAVDLSVDEFGAPTPLTCSRTAARCSVPRLHRTRGGRACRGGSKPTGSSALMPGAARPRIRVAAR